MLVAWHGYAIISCIPRSSSLSILQVLNASTDSAASIYLFHRQLPLPTSVMARHGRRGRGHNSDGRMCIRASSDAQLT
jgi:hypothetical protein